MTAGKPRFYLDTDLFGDPVIVDRERGLGYPFCLTPPEKLQLLVDEANADPAVIGGYSPARLDSLGVTSHYRDAVRRLLRRLRRRAG